MFPDLDPVTVRTAFRQAAEWLADRTSHITDDAVWDDPALGVWSVRELVGHALRAVETVETYLASPAETVTLDSPEQYYRVVMSSSTIHDEVAERGRQAGAALGADPAAVVNRTVDRVLALVDAAPDDAPCGTFAGGIRLIDYLPTRIVELVVHTLDLCQATGPQLAQVPPDASAVALTVLLRIKPVHADVLLGLTGRKPMSLNVLA